MTRGNSGKKITLVPVGTRKTSVEKKGEGRSKKATEKGSESEPTATRGPGGVRRGITTAGKGGGKPEALVEIGTKTQKFPTPGDEERYHFEGIWVQCRERTTERLEKKKKKTRETRKTRKTIKRGKGKGGDKKNRNNNWERKIIYGEGHSAEEATYTSTEPQQPKRNYTIPEEKRYRSGKKKRNDDEGAENTEIGPKKTQKQLRKKGKGQVLGQDTLRGIP